MDVRAAKTKIVFQWTPPPRTCPCPACKSQNTRTTSKQEHARYHKCQDCGQTWATTD
jgi:transposase-like protein